MTVFLDTIPINLESVNKNVEPTKFMTLISNNADVWMVWLVSMKPVLSVLQELHQPLMDQDVQHVEITNS